MNVTVTIYMHRESDLGLVGLIVLGARKKYTLWFIVSDNLLQVSRNKSETNQYFFKYQLGDSGILVHSSLQKVLSELLISFLVVDMNLLMKQYGDIIDQEELYISDKLDGKHASRVVKSERVFTISEQSMQVWGSFEKSLKS